MNVPANLRNALLCDCAGGCGSPVEVTPYHGWQPANIVNLHNLEAEHQCADCGAIFCDYCAEDMHIWEEGGADDSAVTSEMLLCDACHGKRGGKP
jgi:5-methylcytosine-specific restriction endonuclease McrA